MSEVDDALPSGWRWVRLDELRAPDAPIVYGIILPGDDAVGGVPYIRPVDIRDDGTIDMASVKRTTPAIAKKYARAAVRAGDIVLSIVGTIGKVCVVPHDLDGGNITQSSVRVRVSPEASAAYIRYALQAPQLRRQYDQHRFGIAVQRLNVAHARELVVPIAPRREQDRIVDALEEHLSDIDAGVASVERALANVKRYRASVLKAACEGKLVPTEADLARREGRAYESGEELLARVLRERRARWEAERVAGKRGKAKYEEPAAPDASSLPEVPEGWAWATLRALADIKGGITKGQKRRADDVLQQVPYLRVANVQRGRIDLSEVKEIEATAEEVEDLRLVRGDVLFNEGGDRDKLGRGWIWEEQIPLCIHQNHVFRARLPLALIEPKFVSWYGNSFGQKYFLDQGKQTTNLASINMTKLGALPVPVPPLAEQKRIVAEVERLLSVADEVDASLQAQLTRAQRLRQAVLKRAFEGQLLGSHRTVSPVPTTAAPAVTVDTPPPSRELPANAVGARLAAFASWKDEADAQLARRWGISLAHVDVLRRSEVIVEPGLLSHASRALAPVLSGLTAAQIRAVLDDLALMDDAASDGPTLMAARSRA